MDEEIFVDSHLQGFKVPFFGVHLFRSTFKHYVLADLIHHLEELFADVAILHDLAPHSVDRLALFVHDVVIFKQVLPYLEVMAFNPGLGALDGLGDDGMFYGRVFIHTELAQNRRYPVGTEEAHDLVFKGNIKTGRPGISLPARPPAQLVVDTPGFMPLRAKDMEAPQPDDLFLVGGTEGLCFLQ